MADPPDVFAPIRAKAAQTLRGLADKQRQLAEGWLALANKHASLSTSMIADALESGTLKPEVVLSNTTAMTIDCVSSTLNIWLGTVPVPGGEDFQQIVFHADRNAETVGPIALAGVSPSDFADISCTPLTLMGGATTLTITLTTDTDLQAVMVDVRDLKPDGNPRPVGRYTGEITLDLEAGETKLLAVVLLVRTPGA